MSATIPFLRPEVPPWDAVRPYFAESEHAGWYSNGGPCAQALARRLAERLGGTVACVPVANCTLGLALALRAALGEPRSGARPLVLTPSYTFTAAACAIRWAGFEPAFVDVDPAGWHLDPARLESALAADRGRVAGVLAACTFGSPPDAATRAAWRAACAAADVPLVVDSAAGFGATDASDTPLGALGDTEVFSFHATKPFAIGEGGAVATADRVVAERVARLANFDLDRATAASATPGLNAKLSEVHAATALAALDRFDAVLCRRRSAASGLLAAIDRLDVGLVAQATSGRPTWQFVPVLAPDPAVRERILAASASADVGVRRYHDPPLHRHPAFAGCPRTDALAVTEDLAARSVSLPLPAGAEEHERILDLLATAGVGAC